MSKLKQMTLVVSLIICALPFSTVAAEVGVTPSTIKVGNIQGVTGPIGWLSEQSKMGVEAYFRFINDSGGIYGRKIEFVFEDDGYQPVRTVAAYKKLVGLDKVFAICANQGTVTTDAILPLVEEDKVPLVAPFNLGLAVRTPPKRYVFPFIASYYDQFQVMGDFIATQLKKTKVAYLYQNDEAGQAGLKGLTKGLKQHGIDLSLEIPFETRTKDFSAIVLKARQANPEVVQILTVPVNSSIILKEIAKIGWQPIIAGHSPLVDEQVLELSGDASEGLMIAGAMALHDRDEIPEVKEYRDNLAKYFPKAKPTSWGLQAYCAGKIFIEGVKRAGRELSREKLVEAFEGFKDYKTGIVGPITYGPGNRKGNQSVTVIQIKNRKFVRITDWIAPRD
jgi:branched-chain amino acid transport system substrate-binding protein